MNAPVKSNPSFEQLFFANFPDDPKEWPICMKVMAFTVVASVTFSPSELVEDQDYSDGQNFVVNVKKDTICEVSLIDEDEPVDIKAHELARMAGCSLHKLGDLVALSCNKEICTRIWSEIIGGYRG